MKRITSVFLIIASISATTFARASASSFSAGDSAELARFFAAGGRFETLDGEPIDPARFDLRRHPRFVVRPGGSGERVVFDLNSDRLRLEVLDDQCQTAQSCRINSFVRLSSATDDPKKSSGVDPYLGVAAFGFGLLTTTCAAGMGTCPMVAALIVGYMALDAFERYDQRHHPAREQDPLPLRRK